MGKIKSLCNTCILLLLQDTNNTNGSGPLFLSLKALNQAKTMIGIDRALSLYKKFYSSNSNNISNNQSNNCSYVELKDAIFRKISKLKLPILVPQRFMDLGTQIFEYVLLKFRAELPIDEIIVSPRAIFYFHKNELHIRKYQGEYFKIKCEKISIDDTFIKSYYLSWCDDGRWLRFIKFQQHKKTKEIVINKCIHVDIEDRVIKQFPNEKNLELLGFNRNKPELIKLEKLSNDNYQIKIISVFGITNKILKTLNWKPTQQNKTIQMNKLN